MNKVDEYYIEDNVILGMGHYRIVKKGYKINNNNINNRHYYALKMIQEVIIKGSNDIIMLQKLIKEMEKEYVILKTLSHKSLPKVISFLPNVTCYKIDGSQYRTPLLVMEYIPHKLKYDENENNIRRIFSQLINVIEYLHQNNIYHCDLKPQNIMFDDDNNLKLIDFGSAVSKDYEYELDGTVSMMSPEVYTKWRELMSDDPIALLHQLKEENAGYDGFIHGWFYIITNSPRFMWKSNLLKWKHKKLKLQSNKNHQNKNDKNHQNKNSKNSNLKKKNHNSLQKNIKFDLSAIDIFGMGVILFYLFYNERPYIACSPFCPRFSLTLMNETNKEFWKHVDNRIYTNLTWKFIKQKFNLKRRRKGKSSWKYMKHKKKSSYEYRDLVNKLLHLNPKDRIRMKEIKEHVWIIGEKFISKL